MSKYRAIVSITFDEKDLERLAKALCVHVKSVDAMDAVNSNLDNLSVGIGRLEQLFVKGKPTIDNLSDELLIAITPHRDL